MRELNRVRYAFRILMPGDQAILKEFMYQAIYVRPGQKPYPREVMKVPEIARYATHWGRPDDFGILALDESSGQPVGAAWYRLFPAHEKGFGFVDENTPELGMSVLEPYRGRGMGTRLLDQLLDEAAQHFQQISLSVDLENPAKRMYRRAGFTDWKNDGDSATMIKVFK